MSAVVSDQKRIKSANRVLEIIELFDNERQSVTVMDVSRALGVPQSSTSELLRVLVQKGYLTRDRLARRFRPGSRTALLGSWVQPERFRHGHIFRLMDELKEMSGEATALCSLVGTTLQHLHIVGTQIPRALCGSSEHHPLHSPFGMAILSTAPREQVRKLVHRLNAESEPERRIPFVDVADELDRICTRGYVVGKLTQGYSGLAVLLPQKVGRDEEPLSIGLIGPTDRLLRREEHYLGLVHDAISASRSRACVLASSAEAAKSARRSATAF